VSRKQLSGRDPATGAGVQLTIENGIILNIATAETFDDVWISAGLVDLQVNGYRGLDINGPDLRPEVVSQLTRALLATGVTAFAPTVCTAPEADIVQRLAAIAEARTQDPLVRACIPFIHVEGPHISPRDGYRGAHPLASVRPPSLREFQLWQDACDGLVGLVTLSPHSPAAEEYISAVTQCGVHVSLGHTHASHAQITAAADAGARMSTHLGNGLALQVDRHPNPIWSQLADDRLTATFIADGHHLPAETLKAMIRAKGIECSILVSDSVALAGMPPGCYETPIGGRVELSSDGRISMEGTSTLAGAGVPLVVCVGLATGMTGRPLAEVLTMATRNPGRFAGDRGTLAPGALADIFRFHWNAQKCAITVKDVWLAGEPVYQAAS
jgi:N-acetylglucosamine-6-phosphate deacetylase